MTTNEDAAHNKALIETRRLRIVRDESHRIFLEDSAAHDRAYTAFYVDELALLEEGYDA
jgi:hypothetical protein